MSNNPTTTYFNINKWPIIFFTANGDNQMMDQYFEDFKREYLSLLVRCKKNNEQIVLICNINSSGNFEMANIMKFAKFNKEIHAFNKAYVKCVAMLCADRNFKNILNIYFTFAKPASPYKLCRSHLKVDKYLKEKWGITFESIYFDGFNNINYKKIDSTIEDGHDDVEEEIGLDYIPEEEDTLKKSNIEEVKV
jgi:hypothetical protein